MPLRGAMEREWNVPLLLQVVERNVLHVGVGGVAVGADPERLADKLLGRVAETIFSKAHALCKLTEEPHVRPRLAEGFDGLVRKLHEVVSVRALDIGVLEERSCGQDVIGVIGGVSEKLLV